MFFHLYQQNKSSGSNIKFRLASNYCKRVLEAAKLVYANKAKDSITFQKFGSQALRTNSVLKLFPKIFFKNSSLDDSGISLPSFPSITNLKLHNISVTPKMVKKVILNLIHQGHLVLIVFQCWF